MLTVEQREARLSYVGGSEVASIVPGVQAYSTPLEIWLRKTRPEADDTLDEGVGSLLYWGSVLEDPIAKAFGHDAGVKVQRRNKAYRDDEHPWRGALVDRWIVGQGCGLEVKNRGLWRTKEYGPSGSDQCLDTDLVQCQWCMSLSGATRWYMAVLLGGNDFRWFRVERDEQLIGAMREAVDDFWLNCVVAGVMPPPQTVDDCLLKYPRAMRETKVANAHVLELMAEFKSLKAGAKTLETGLEELKVQIMDFMGDAGALMHPDGGKKLAIWPRFDRSSVDGKRLLAEYPDIHAEVVKVGRSHQFRAL